MAEGTDRGLVCNKCLESNSTNRALISCECFDYKAHRGKHGRRLVRVMWTGHRLEEVSRSTVARSRIRPMPNVDLIGKFSLCDMVRCKGERCTYPHSIEEKDAWNKELIGRSYENKAQAQNPVLPPPNLDNEPDWPTLSGSPASQDPNKWSVVSAWNTPLRRKTVITSSGKISSHDRSRHSEVVQTLEYPSTSVVQPHSKKQQVSSTQIIKRGPPPKPSPLVEPRLGSQVKAGHPVSARPSKSQSNSQELTFAPVDFQFLQAQDESHINNNEFVFQSQPMEDTDANCQSQTSVQFEPYLSTDSGINQSSHLLHSQASTQASIVDDPSVIGHSVGSHVAHLQNEPVLPMKQKPELGSSPWPEFVTSTVNSVELSLPGVSATRPPVGVPFVPYETGHNQFKDFTPAEVRHVHQDLIEADYKRVFTSLLSEEQEVHRAKLSKCNGMYTLILYKVGERPHEIAREFEATQFGCLKGLKSDHIAYATQASQHAVISLVERNVEFQVQIARSYQLTEDVLYIAIDNYNHRRIQESFPKWKSQKVNVYFKLKDSYFRALKESVKRLPFQIIQRILPKAQSFYDHPVPLSEIDLGECERYCLPDHGQLSALKTMVSCPANGPPILIIGPFGAGKSRVLAIAAFRFMQEKRKGDNSPPRILVCVHQRASVESFLNSFCSLVTSKKHTDIFVVQNYGNPVNFSLKRWYYTIDKFKSSYHYGIRNSVLVITTCMTSRSLSFLPRDFFSHILLDEGAQMREPENITPLCLATINTKIVVAGDPNQVGPATLVLGNRTQLSASLLERLHSTYVQLGDLASKYLVTLMSNYRCNDAILKLVGNLYYDFPLIWAQNQPAPPPHPDAASYPLLFICSSTDENERFTSTSNRKEAEILLEELVDKTKRWPPAWREVDPSQFCVMSPNRAQLTLVQKIMRDKRLFQDYHLKKPSCLQTIEIQGREYRALFLSTSEALEEDGSSTDHRRSLADRYVFNTAITRAQSLIVSIGNPFLLLRMEEHMVRRYGKKGKTWSCYLKCCLEHGTLTFHKSLGLNRDDESTCLSKIQSLVEEQQPDSPSAMMAEQHHGGGVPFGEPHVNDELSQTLGPQENTNQPIMLQHPQSQNMAETNSAEQIGLDYQLSNIFTALMQPNPQSLASLSVPTLLHPQFTTEPLNVWQPYNEHQLQGRYMHPQHQQHLQALSTSPHGYYAGIPPEVHVTQTQVTTVEPNLSSQPELDLHQPSQTGSPSTYTTSSPLQVSPNASRGKFFQPANRELNVQIAPQVSYSEVSQVYREQQAENESSPGSICIRNIVEHYVEMTIQLYFENTKSGGGEVTSVEMLGNGVAVVTFKDPEVVERVLQTSHTLFGESTIVTRGQVIPSELTQPQEEVDESQPQGQPLDLDVHKESYDTQPVEPVSTSIKLLNITEHYNEDYIQLYFEKFTGSSDDDIRVEMLGNGEAVVQFDKPEAVEAALQKPLIKFGKCVSVERILPPKTTEDSEATVTSTPTSSLPIEEIDIQQLKAECLAKDPSGIRAHLSLLHVEVDIDTAQNKIKVSPTKHTIAGWQKQAQQQVTLYANEKLLARTRKTRIANSEEGIRELRDFLFQLREKGCFAYELKKENAQLRFAGDEESVKECESKLKEVIEGCKVIEDTVTLSHESYNYLKQIKLSQIESQFPTVTVVQDPDAPALKLKGMHRDIHRFKTTLVEDGVHKTVHVKVDSLIVNLFRTKEGRKQLKGLLAATVCPVVPRFLKCDLSSSISLALLCDPSQEAAANKVAESLRLATDVQRISLPQSFISMKEDIDEEHLTLCKDLETKYFAVVVTSQEYITVAGKKEDVAQSVFELKAFIKKNCTVREHIEVERGVWLLLNEHLKEKWSEVSTQCKQAEVVLKTTKVSRKVYTKPTVRLTGDKLHVQQICDQFKAFLESIYKSMLPVEHPGAMKYFESKQARNILRGIETDKRVVIEVIDPNKELDDHTDSESPSSPHELTQKYVAPLKNGKSIVVYIGDITDFNDADVLVNAANVDLKHLGGVAKAISDKGGPIIQDESLKHVKENGKLKTGEAWLTTAVGNLPCRALVHTVGPRWEHGSANNETLLVKACMQTLQVINTHGYTSVAFPAISSGIYGFPIQVCAQVMIRSILMFYKDYPKSPLQDFNIVVYKTDDAVPFVSTLEQFLPSDKKVEPPAKPQTSTVPAVLKPKPAQKAEILQPASSAASYKVISSSVLEKIRLHKGSILQQKADVYVNTTNKELDLSQGAVSMALLKEGGELLQAECTQKAPVPCGEVAVTGPGNLRCQYVLHTVLPKYDSGQAEKVLRSSIHKCLQQCSQLGVGSIAFPAIGTGNLGYPDDFVAKIMIEAISHYLSTNKDILVHIVIFMENAYSAFKKEFDSLARKCELKPAASLHPSTPASNPIVPAIISSDSGIAGAQMQEESALDSSNSLSTRLPSMKNKSSLLSSVDVPPSPAQDTNQQAMMSFFVNGLKVNVVNGDITEDNSNVIVNCTNANLKLGPQGVAGALRQKGGRQLQQLCDIEMSRLGVRLGGDTVIETRASGSLKSKSIFHVHFDHRNHKGFVKLVLACLQKAEGRRFSTISFPAIGTGGGGYPPDAAALGMLKAIEQFSERYSLNRQLMSLQCIRIVLFHEPTLFHAFATQFGGRSSSGNTTFTDRQATKPNVDWDQTEATPVGAEEEPETTPLEEPSRMVPDVEHDSASEDEGNVEEEEYKEKIEVKIYGENEGVVKSAEKEVQDMISENLVSDTVDIPIAKKLPRAERQKLRLEGKKRTVKITIDEGTQTCIHLSGCKDDVQEIKLFVMSVKDRISREQTTEHLYQTIRWEKQGANGGEYDQDTNYEIEMAYKSKKPTYTHGSPKTKVHFTINFAQMEEKDHHANDSQVKIVRVNKEVEERLKKGELPQNWENMPIDPNKGKEQSLHVVDLKPDSDEYNEVKAAFGTTMTLSSPYYSRYSRSRGPSYYGSIVKIQRIQNPLLYSTYMARKKEMDKHNTPGHQNERKLFHGTSGDICTEINRSGFNRSHSGKHATAYGKGVYFARDANYSASDKYSPPNYRGHKHVYLARVLTGEYTAGIPGNDWIEPPRRDEYDESSSRYDSVANSCSKDPSIFVIFNDAAVYPEYLIVFTQLHVQGPYF